MQTAGVEVVPANVQIPDTKTTVELYLYDTGGNDLFQDTWGQKVRGFMLQRGRASTCSASRGPILSFHICNCR